MGDNNKYFCYFVEGDNEKKIVNELKGKYLESGVINKFNILQETISNHILRKFSSKDWKRDMLNTINLLEKLEKKDFQISKFWINNS